MDRYLVGWLVDGDRGLAVRDGGWLGLGLVQRKCERVRVMICIVQKSKRAASFPGDRKGRERKGREGWEDRLTLDSAEVERVRKYYMLIGTRVYGLLAKF